MKRMCKQWKDGVGSTNLIMNTLRLFVSGFFFRLEKRGERETQMNAINVANGEKSLSLAYHLHTSYNQNDKNIPHCLFFFENLY